MLQHTASYPSILKYSIMQEQENSSTVCLVILIGSSFFPPLENLHIICLNSRTFIFIFVLIILHRILNFSLSLVPFARMRVHLFLFKRDIKDPELEGSNVQSVVTGNKRNDFIRCVWVELPRYLSSVAALGNTGNNFFRGTWRDFMHLPGLSKR